jgi:hypothetical protein
LNKKLCVVGVALLTLGIAGCSADSSSPTSATPVTRVSTHDRSLGTSHFPGESGPSDVSFPPRNEPLLFRNALEVKYRDSLRRSPSQTYVDQEGTVVWTQEYLRYRVNLCSHAEAVSRVMRQIDGQGIPATCGTATRASFPPRNEPFDFMLQLEARYRDGLRRQSDSSFVDVEGNIVWTQEYLRYRVSGCSHADAQTKVFDQIDGRGVADDCTPVGTSFPPPAGCRYCPTPAEQVVSCNGGDYSFEVRPVAEDIQWNTTVTNSGFGIVTITSGATGTGRGTVRFSASRPAYGCDATSVISVGGLSNLFPREEHLVVRR